MANPPETLRERLLGLAPVVTMPPSTDELVPHEAFFEGSVHAAAAFRAAIRDVLDDLLPEPTAEPRWCKDCTHFHSVSRNFPQPDAPGCGVEGLRDPVDGKPVYRRCHEARGPEGNCGPSGKLWQAQS